MAAYEAALSAERLPIGRKHKDGTIGDLVVSFYKSPYFENLKPRSQRVYRQVLDKFRREGWSPLGARHAAPRRHEYHRGNRRDQTRHGEPDAQGNAAAICLRSQEGDADDNPFVGIESYKLGTHHTWTDAEIAAYEAVWPIGTRERLAFDLLLYTGQRVGDVAACVDLISAMALSTSRRKRPGRSGDSRCIRTCRSMKACPTKGLTLSGRRMAARSVGMASRRLLSVLLGPQVYRRSVCTWIAEGADAAVGRARCDYQADCVGVGPQDA